jgi:hypothetical protein
VAALRWLGQQYAARSDVLRVLLGRLSPGSPRVEGQLAETTAWPGATHPRRGHPAARRSRSRGRVGAVRRGCGPPPKRVAVEVELTRKGAARLREAWTRHGRWQRTVYYAPPEVAGYLTGQLQRIRPRHPIQVHPLPEVAGTTYMRPGGAS